MYVRVAKEKKYDKQRDNSQQSSPNTQQQHEEYEWKHILAAFRYVTQRTWSRIPINTKTRILNLVIVCLAGGRNKNIAAKDYEILNAELMSQLGLQDLKIRIPDTIKDVCFPEIPLWIQRFGGVAVVKVHYSNAGQGVYTITRLRNWKIFYNKLRNLNMNASLSSH